MSAGGNGFQFSADELREVLAQWQQINDKLEAARGNAESMTEVIPGASDDASGYAAAKASNSGSAYYAHLLGMKNYTQEYITALTTALNNYRESEEVGRHAATSVETELS